MIITLIWTYCRPSSLTRHKRSKDSILSSEQQLTFQDDLGGGGKHYYASSDNLDPQPLMSDDSSERLLFLDPEVGSDYHDVYDSYDNDTMYINPHKVI